MVKFILSFAAGGAIALLSTLYGIFSLNGFNAPSATAARVYVLRDINFFGRQQPVHLKLETTKGNGNTVQLIFRKPAFSAVELYISDLAGNRIRTLIRRFLPRGAYEISWYGETDLSEPISPGVYVAVLAAEGESRAVKFVWVE